MLIDLTDEEYKQLDAAIDIAISATEIAHNAEGRANLNKLRLRIREDIGNMEMSHARRIWKLNGSSAEKKIASITQLRNTIPISLRQAKELIERVAAEPKEQVAPDAPKAFDPFDL